MNPNNLSAEDTQYDELPSYSPPDERAPAYSRQDGAVALELDRRALVFSLRQTNRRTQKFISMGPSQFVMRGANHFTEIATNLTVGHHDSMPPFPWYSTNREYEINHHSGAGLSRTKPDMSVSAVGRETRAQPAASLRRRSIFGPLTQRRPSPERQQQALPRRGSEQISASTPEPKQNPIASIRFMRSGPLPWTPRAEIKYAEGFVNEFGQDDPNVIHMHSLELKRSMSHGWTFEMFGRKHAWQLATIPTRLELFDLEAELKIATFTYSSMGSWASKDAEVGRLRVPLQLGPESTYANGANIEVRGGMQDGLMEWIIATVIVAITHWKNECKILVN